MKHQEIYGNKSPLALMFIIGLGLFLGLSVVKGYFDKSDQLIVITQAQVDLLSQNFTQTWKRAPTEKELNAQIENLIKEEVLFREAVKMGLDESDPAIKQRLRQVLELMLDDYAAVYPSEDQLRKYLNANEDKFRQDSRISLRHYYFEQETKGESERQLTKLRNNLPVDQDRLGDLAIIPGQLDDRSYSSIERLFGEEFASQVFELKSGEWQGPIPSAYGWHLVKVSEITPGFVPDLDEIWDAVELEWTGEMREQKKEAQFQKMKEKYSISFTY